TPAGVAIPAHAVDGTLTPPTHLFNGYRHCATDADRPSYQQQADDCPDHHLVELRGREVE
ncbi:hypothetical protein, partial [Streptomyces sp. E5N298]|uniref:hypothetical protein n=1 Tax=Streptomyces sp. E5N298 TaxID=1851983 RepID=UPI001EE7AB2A